MRKWLLAGLGLAILLTLFVRCEAFQGRRQEVYTDPQAAGPDFAVQGEYVGEITGKGKLGAQVIADGDGQFTVVFLPGGLPGEGWDSKTRIKAPAKTTDGKTAFDGSDWNVSVTSVRLARRMRSANGTDRDPSRFRRSAPSMSSTSSAAAPLSGDSASRFASSSRRAAIAAAAP